MSAVQLMCNSSGVLQGFAILTIDCASGVPTYLYQALNTTTTSSTRPGTWFPCCPEMNAAGSHPMFTDGTDLATFVGYVFIRFDAETSVYQQQWVTVGGVITTTKPSGWEQGACGATDGGGGGGGGAIADLPGSTHLYLPAGTVLDDTKYPDWAVSGLSASARNDTLSIPCGYDGADWCRLVVSVKNVTGVLTADLTVRLKDLTNAADIATITFTSGTSPSSGELWDDVTIGSGSFVDNTHIQWHIVSAEDNNAFAIHAEAFYLLTVDAT